MIGHPSETLEDVQAIIDLAIAVLAEGRKIHGRKAKVNVGVSTFVPKAHTPFQWVPLDTLEQIRAKQALLQRGMRGAGLHLRWNRPEETLLEAFLGRGDRRLGAVIQRAWQLGTKFDAWQEHHDHAAWEQAFAENGLDIDFYTHRPRPTDEVFPWDHIDIAVKKSFSLRLPDVPAWRDAPGLPGALLRLRHPAQVRAAAHGYPRRRLAVPAGCAARPAQAPGNGCDFARRSVTSW